MYENNMNNIQSNINVGQVQQPIEYAGAKERIIIFLKDLLSLYGLAMVIFLIATIVQFILAVISGLNGVQTDDNNSLYTLIQVTLPMLLMVFGYPIKYFISCLSETHTTKNLRKKGYVVLNENGSELSTGQAIGRAIILILTYCFGLMHVSLITILVTDKKQALQDLILKQVVVKRIQ